MHSRGTRGELGGGDGERVGSEAEERGRGPPGWGWTPKSFKSEDRQLGR